VSLKQIDTEEAAGNFAKVSRLIDLYIAENELSPVSVYELNARKDIMQRTPAAYCFHRFNRSDFCTDCG